MKTVVLSPQLIHTGNLILVNDRYPRRETITKQHLTRIYQEKNNFFLKRQDADALCQLMDAIGCWREIKLMSA